MAFTMGAQNVLEGGVIGGDPKLSPSSAPRVCSFTETSPVFLFPLFNQKVPGDGREGKQHGTQRRARHSCQGPLTGAHGFGGSRSLWRRRLGRRS